MLFLLFTLIALELILTDATAYYFLFCSSFIFLTTYKAIAVLFLVSFALILVFLATIETLPLLVSLTLVVELAEVFVRIVVLATVVLFFSTRTVWLLLSRWNDVSKESYFLRRSAKESFSSCDCS